MADMKIIIPEGAELNDGDLENVTGGMDIKQNLNPWGTSIIEITLYPGESAVREIAMAIQKHPVSVSDPNNLMVTVPRLLDKYIDETRHVKVEVNVVKALSEYKIGNITYTL